MAGSWTLEVGIIATMKKATSTENRGFWKQQLSDGLSKMGIQVSEPQQQHLLDYLALMVKWNKVYNLTAIRDPDEMVSRQLLDSLSILPWVSGKRILDVGTGAGLPGIPLAIALPESDFTLLDSNGKKTRFVQQAVAELGLQNVRVLHARVEALGQEAGFDVITSRAFASLQDFVSLTKYLLAEDGVWLAMKGQADREEGELPAGLEITIHRLSVPGCQAERHLVEARWK